MLQFDVYFVLVRCSYRELHVMNYEAKEEKWNWSADLLMNVRKFILHLIAFIRNQAWKHHFSGLLIFNNSIEPNLVPLHIQI